MQSLESEIARLRQDAHGDNPPKPATPTPRGSRGTGSHAEKIVHEMMAYVQQHYHRPMSLGDVAAALKMNAAYLSSLFSTTAGVTFHQYLDDLRLAKAKELLRNQGSRACEVACAVGYTSAAHFGRAFKAHTGLSPGHWRETVTAQ